MSVKPFRYTFTVPLHDIDAAGVMFYGNLFRHAHDAYEAFMRTIGFPLERLIREGGPLLPLVHAEADYRLALRHGDTVLVELCVSAVGGASFTVGYLFLDGTGQVRATARTVHVHLSADGASSSALPPTLAAELAGRRCQGDAEQMPS